MPTAPLAKAHLAQYTIKTSDVLAEMRVDVLEEGTGKVIWFKKRIMTEDEIVESVVDSATGTIRWSIHRPKRGWYLRVRCPSFPPGTFIPITPPAPRPPPAPLPAGSATLPTLITPEHPDGTLTFAIRTTLPEPEKAAPGEVRIHVSLHSYPPTPPIVASPPSSSQSSLIIPSPQELKAKLHTIAPQSPSSVTHFVFYPSLPIPPSGPASPAPMSLLSRALSYITPTLPMQSTASFTLIPVSASPYVGDVILPLLTFTDRTPTFSVLTTGLLEVNKGMERQMGVDPAFWVAVALAYLEYLTERDVSDVRVWDQCSHSLPANLVISRGREWVKVINGLYAQG